MKPFFRILFSILGLLLLVLLVGPLLVPVPPLAGAASVEQLADPDSQFTIINGLRVHYKTAGRGKPALILMHGFGASLFSWREVFSPLAKENTVVAFDRPAFGLTERPLQWQGQNPYSPEASVDLTVGLMDQLDLQEGILIGNSAGGSVAMQTALSYPERVKALILVDPSVYTGGAPQWVSLLSGTPQMNRLGPLLVRGIQKSGNNLILRAWHNPENVTPEIIDGYRKPLQLPNWDRALWEFSKTGRPTGLAGQLQELNLPVLVITGDDDRIVPTKESIRLASELPNAELVLIPQCGHVPQEECPQAFLEAVNNFLDRLPKDESS